jgi:hypothetical protein
MEQTAAAIAYGTVPQSQLRPAPIWPLGCQSMAIFGAPFISPVSLLFRVATHVDFLLGGVAPH